MTLFELVQRLDEFDDSDPSRPLIIYAQHGADAERKSPTLVCPRNEGTVSRVLSTPPSPRSSA